MTQTKKILIERDRVIQSTRRMMDAYVAWGNERQYGKNYNTMYGDVTEFLNFRLETAESCLQLIEQERVADSLGLCRAMLENYLLFKLLCRGHRFFRLQSLEGLKPAEVKARLAKQQQELADKHAKGEDLSCLYVEMYPRRNKHLMYVFKGFRDQTDPDFIIPLHYFVYFREFRPEAMRLRDEDYFAYYEPDPTVTAAHRTHRLETTDRYQQFLSYDALLFCLDINELVTKVEKTRIEAHYTFLGTFLHPTDGAARSLQVSANSHNGRPAIGGEHSYTDTAKLLAALYVAKLVTGMLNEIAGLFESASVEHVANPATANLRSVVTDISKSVNYFWFIDDQAPFYDRFYHAIHWVSDEDLESFGGYPGVPSALVKFNQHIYSHLRDSLNGWSNQHVGPYKSPLD